MALTRFDTSRAIFVTGSSLPNIYNVSLHDFYSCRLLLQRDAIACAVLKEDATVDLTLVEVLLLVSAIDDIRAARRFFQHADLELASTSKVGGLRTSN